MSKPTFEVDKTGLAKILERRGKHFAVAELIQNAWDEDATEVEVTLRPDKTPKGEPQMYELVVADNNPDGFKDLTHAYTLFAESEKKGKATKRGRFNLGEKLVIAMCERAVIETTTGSVLFNEGGRDHSDATTEFGSVFTGVMPMTKDEAAEVERVVHQLLPPEGVKTTFNGKQIEYREPVKVVEAKLATELADADGRIKRTTRKTTVAIHEPREGERGMVYELGIPVVETGDRWHVDVGQKVPVNLERDNVPPALMRDLRAHR